MTANGVVRPHVVYAVTVATTARAFLRGQMAAVKAAGYDVTLICSPDPGLDQLAVDEGIRVVTVPMTRGFSVAQDLVALRRLVDLFRREQVDIVNAGTPKAGLLGMVAAWIARVPVRVYHLRGLRMESLTGVKRRILVATERLAAMCATVVVCNSNSLRSTAIELGLAPSRKAIVLGMGSSNGVDAARFEQTQALLSRSDEIRNRLDLPKGVPVVGFVGRLTRDKGIDDLVTAFKSLQRVFPELRLLLVGDLEEQDPIADESARFIRTSQQAVTTGFVKDTAPYYPLMDVLAFPSYREGLPNAPLEAAAASIPTVGFRATGVADAVQDGVTGVLVEVGNAAALASALATVLSSSEVRTQLGRNARERVLREFQPEVVWANWLDLYRRELTTARHGTSGGKVASA
jgi:glycosyltransferase involved in cell wall biosynthesis